MPLPRRTPEQVREDSVRWVVARRAGQTVAEIATAVGASPAAVSRATSAHGPFPVMRRVTAQERVEWVAQRRDGVTPMQIAAGADVPVSPSAVARATAPFGPFPSTPAPARWSPQDAARWAELRRRRVPLTTIVEDENSPAPYVYRRDQLDQLDDVSSGAARPDRGFMTGPDGRVVPGRVTVAMVKAATKATGPFPTPLLGPPGLVGVRAVAEMAQLSQPTIAHRLARGQLPPPRVVTGSGRLLWHPDDIRTWLEQLDLPTCSVCGAKARRLDRHHQVRHGVAPPPH